MERFKSRVLWVIVLIGVFLFVDGINNMIDSKKTPIDFATMTEADFKNGVIVEGDIDYNFGAFEEEYRTTYGIKTGESDYVYMVPFQDNKFIGVKSFTSEQQEQLDLQTDQTYNVVAGTSSDNPSPVHFKGRIATMGTEEKGYLKDYMISMGYTQSEIDNSMLGYRIELVSFSGGLGMIALGGGLILIGLIVVIVPMIQNKRKQDMLNNMPISPRTYKDESTSYTSPETIKMPSGVIEDDFPTFDEPENTYAKPETAATQETPKSGLSLKLKDD